MTQVIEVSSTLVRVAQDRIHELRSQGLPVSEALLKVAEAPLAPDELEPDLTVGLPRRSRTASVALDRSGGNDLSLG